MQNAVLYSFRRCPYAIRARLALRYSGIQVELREVVLKDKPPSMLIASPKATVPILVLNDKRTLDESLDIMLWALDQNDPDKWLTSNNKNDQLAIIEKSDHEFKHWLDRYKYSDRYPEESQDHYLDQCLVFLDQLESSIKKYGFLFRDQSCLADWAIFPFVRQFAFVDKTLFDCLAIPNTQRWLNYFLEDSLFKHCMEKYEPWQEATIGGNF